MLTGTRPGRSLCSPQHPQSPYGQKIETAGSVGSIRVRRSLAACRALLYCDDQWRPSRIGREGKLMDLARILAYVTGPVDQELLARNEYLAAENRILKA